MATPARRLPPAAEGSPGFAALLSALLPGLGQMYLGRWRRGVLLLALPAAAALAFTAVILSGGSVTSLVLQQAKLFVLLLVGGLFAYHVVVSADAFAGPLRAPRGRHAVDYALLAAIVLGLVVMYHGAYRYSLGWADLVTAVFEPPAGRTIGAGTPRAGTSTAPGWSGRDRLNVLLLGIDTREGASETQNTDAIILLSLEPRERTAVMLSIPRDTLVDIPGVGRDKVNAAYAYAGDPRKGPDLARRTVEAFLGIPIHSYAIIDFEAFRQTVWSVGGVLVDVRRPLRDERYPTNDFGIERFELRAGPQLMDGDDALRYARSRHDSNDFSRARRQQTVVFALRERFALAGLFRLPGIVERVGPLVRTNFDPGNILPLARTVLSLDASEITSDVLLPCSGDLPPHCELREENGEKGYYLIPDVPKVRALVADLFAGRKPASAR
ncbi:MAG: LytR family transcriptional regulator [Chloroflexi bacterium]|nr:LytR family transcriptional regulator [Chloroflexota bacterium]